MKDYDTYDYAYKNGYKQGVKDLSEKLCEEVSKIFSFSQSILIRAKIKEIAEKCDG